MPDTTKTPGEIVREVAAHPEVTAAKVALAHGISTLMDDLVSQTARSTGLPVMAITREILLASLSVQAGNVFLNMPRAMPEVLRDKLFCELIEKALMVGVSLGKLAIQQDASIEETFKRENAPSTSTVN